MCRASVAAFLAVAVEKWQSFVSSVVPLRFDLQRHRDAL